MSAERSTIEKLKDVIVFRYLGDQELADVLEISDVLYYEEGDGVISEGEVNQHLYAVLEGSVNVTTSGPGKEVFICAIGAGEVFGEAGIFLTVRRTANVVSAGNTALLRIHRKALLQFIKKYPSAGIKMLMVIIYGLLKKLRESNQELAFERKSDLHQEDIDAMVDNLMKEDLD